MILFGVSGKYARTIAPGRRQVNLLATRKREHSRKPDEQYGIIEAPAESWAIPGAIRPWKAQWMAQLGKSSRGNVLADLENLPI